ncbi:MAG: hypothetical protein KC731_10590 [Myxococcales bacterium]|nr:hypothetical protein [Myxococcales bacterium]
MNPLAAHAWKEAAETLGLELVTATGKRARGRQGRQHRMRGVIGGRKVRVRFGLRVPADAITVIEVRLLQPLLLGAEIGVATPPRTSTGVVLGSVIERHVSGPGRARAQAMLDTKTGLRLGERILALGSFGWAELRDQMLEAHAEIATDEPRDYVQLVRLACEVASLAEKAREELEPSPVELALAANLARAASTLGLDLDRRRLAAAGTMRGAKVRAGLEVEPEPMLTCRVTFAQPSVWLVSLKPRVGLPASVARFITRLTSRSRCDLGAHFDVAGDLEGRVSEATCRKMVELASHGHLEADAGQLIYRSRELDLRIDELLASLAEVGDALTTKVAARPYR